MSMEILNFPKIAIGATFVVDGETYTKRSELVYTDVAGIEYYIGWVFDRKIKLPEPAGAAAPAAPTARPPVDIAGGNVTPILADADGHVVLSDKDVERIARRVAEILKGCC